jgi:hypothetical protein
MAAGPDNTNADVRLPAGMTRSHARQCVPRSWQDVVDFGLILWILRAPLTAVLIGFVLLDYAPQAQDLLVEFAGDYGRIALFLLLLSFVWAATTHYSARLLLDTDKRYRAYADARGSVYLACIERWIPRLLGTLPFLAVLIASERSIWNLPDIADKGVMAAVERTLRTFDVLVGIAAMAFVAYTVIRPSIKETRGVKSAEIKSDRFLRSVGLRPSHERIPPGIPTAQPSLGPLLLFFVFLLSAGIIVLGADHIADWLPRALIVPVILGGWLPLLTLLSGLGRRWRAPLMVGVIALIAVLSAILGDNHSVARIDAADVLGRPIDTSSLDLKRAVELWMKENDCSADASSCPRPLIVASAGGASRAGFFTASIIGQLLDDARAHASQRDRLPLDESKVRKRIFAISGVSGGSVGAVMTVAALARAGPSTKNPCISRHPSLWYGGDINNWRDCLEALMAGDFLTPTLIGLIFHDSIRFGWWRDRAALLERSWELRFADVMEARDANWQNACPGDLRCPFTTARPREGLWIPLLILNGTSAATGGRIITTILNSQYAAAGDCPTRASSRVTADTKAKSRTAQSFVTDEPAADCAVFMEATRFHTLLADSSEPDFWPSVQRLFLWEYLREKLSFWFKKRHLDDVALSTAAHNSARFPIISPPGAIRNVRHTVVDRIVDGGYIENYGALSAMELAVAVHTAQPQLAPFVLVISNDPDEDPSLNRLAVPDPVFLTDVSIPIEAIANARTGRGRLAVQQLNAVLDVLTQSSCGPDSAHVRVWPQYHQSGEGKAEKKTSRPVSMSWWLSTPIQIHLHQQTEDTKNQNENNGELEKTWRAVENTSSCMPAKNGVR